MPGTGVTGVWRPPFRAREGPLLRWVSAWARADQDPRLHCLAGHRTGVYTMDFTQPAGLSFARSNTLSQAADRSATSSPALANLTSASNGESKHRLQQPKRRM